MGFIRGVITGIGIAAAAAAWYMSRAGQDFRDRYRVDRKLGDFGDEIEVRTRDVRAKVGPMVADVRSQACLLYTSPSPRDRQKSRMPSSA